MIVQAKVAKDNNELLGWMLNGAGWLCMSETQRGTFRRAARVLNMMDDRKDNDDGQQCD